MTREEAIKQLNEVTIYHQGKCTREALNIAINDIEKQIPQKPIDDGMYHLECPNCCERVVNEYCSHCGQKIDWSKE